MSTQSPAFPNFDLNRRHVLYFDPRGHLHHYCPYRFARLLRGEPDTTLPQLAGHRIRFAVIHTERFIPNLHPLYEDYPILPIDAQGQVDRTGEYERLQVEVDRLEARNYRPDPSPSDNLIEPAKTWTPDPFTRRRLLLALRRPADLVTPRLIPLVA